MEWIKCSDRMPGDNGSECQHDNVYVYSSTRKLHGIAQWYDEWVIVGDVGVYSCCLALELESGDVTHWMPLPPSPKENQAYDCPDDSICGRMMQYPFCKKHRHPNDDPIEIKK